MTPPTSDLVRKARRLLAIEAEADRLRAELAPLLAAEYATGRPLSDTATETGLKRTRIIAWLKAAGVELDRGPRNRYTAPSTLPAQRRQVRS